MVGLGRSGAAQAGLALALILAAGHSGARGQPEAPAATGHDLIPAQELTTAREALSLDGAWDFSYDPQGVGEQRRWFDPAASLPETTVVPGCVQAHHHPSSGMTTEDYAKFHAAHGEFMMDLKYPCTAPAWQRKRFVLPAAWQGRRAWLHLGGATPAADVWFNGVKLGSTVSSRTPLRRDLTELGRWGLENTLVVRTYWPEGPRLDGVYSYFSAFSGLYRGARIEAVAPVSVAQLHVLGATDPPSAQLSFTIDGPAAARRGLRARCAVTSLDGQQEFAADVPLGTEGAADGRVTARIAMPGARLWSPQAPHLYRATVQLLDGDRVLDSAAARFGLRSIRREGRRILLNGTPIFLRGACDDHVYPHTICPPASKDFFVERLRRAKRYGFNYTKSCMEVFTEEFLDAADEVGLLVCEEMPFGLTGPYRTTIRDQMPAEYRALYSRELANIIRSDRNHPSVVLYSMASEFNVNAMKDDVFQLFCRDLPATARKLNPNALVVDITCAFTDWDRKTPRGARTTDLIEEIAGDQFVQEPLSYPILGQYDHLDRPFLLHEYNWWTSLPEPALAPRYEGLPYKLNGVPEMEAAAQKVGLTGQLPRFVENSRRLKRVLQKSGLELARREGRISGYHLWLISGFSWCQEGVFNEFYEEAPDIGAEEFRTFNDDTVVLLDDRNRRAFERGMRAALGVEVSHFGPRPLSDPAVEWRLEQGGDVVGKGVVRFAPIPCGVLTEARPLGLVMPAGPDAAQFDLHVVLRDDGREVCRNHWTLWALPAPRGGPWEPDVATDLAYLAGPYPRMKCLGPAPTAETKVIVTDRMDEALLDYLDRGGRVVLLSDGALKDYRPGVEYRPGERLAASERFNALFRSPPWNLGAHGNMGTVVADHPALRGFPHGGWCDLQFLHLVHGAFPILLEPYRPDRIEPIIRSIGHKNTMVDKAYLFEVGVGRGALLATSLRIAETYATYPESRRLLECLLSYAAGEAFAPQIKVTRERLAASVVRR